MSPATGDRCERTIESQLNYVLLLKSCLEYIGILKDALSTAQHPYFKSIHNVRLTIIIRIIKSSTYYLVAASRGF